jgi:hypothetical protein
VTRLAKAVAAVAAFVLLGACHKDDYVSAPNYGQHFLYGGYYPPPYGYPPSQPYGYPPQPYHYQPPPQPPAYPATATQPPPVPTGPEAANDEARQYTLSRINAIRAQNGRGALVLDSALNQFAQAGSVELSQDHRPHRHFMQQAESCGCDLRAENQGDPTGWMPGPVHTQIDQILQLMMSEGPGGGHYENILNARSRRLGVGIVNPGGALYFTNDFAQ